MKRHFVPRRRRLTSRPTRTRSPFVIAALFLSFSGSLSTQTGRQSPHSSPGTAGATLIVEGLAVQLDSTRTYDPSYAALDYPGGDVPIQTGVCADVIVRSFRHAGIDLQVEVHNDMQAHFRAYPQRWGARGPDPNIDHRRVPNLMTYFKRQGRSLSISDSAKNFHPGDVVAWKLPGNLYHIGIVSDRMSADGRPIIAHNIGRGAELSDCLFAWEMIGHYRWFQ